MASAQATNGVPVIRVEGVTKTYGDVHAVDGVSMELVAGELVAITGPSGSGKSTLLGMLGLLETPSNGRYEFRGEAVSGLRDGQASRLRNESFGFVFQQFHLLPDLSAWENVARPLVYSGTAKQERRSRAMALLSRLGLEGRANHRPAQLSGGEQQRVAIARALINDPEVVLADEPTGNLPKAQWQPVLELLRQLSGRGRTVVVVTHEPEVAAIAGRKLGMLDGRLSSS